MRQVRLASSLPSNLSVATDGEEALTFLRRKGKHAEAPRPDLILLDLKLPGKNGLEVLAEVKADDQLRRIPVVLLTSSDTPKDIHRAYELQASCYITKPGDLVQLVQVMRSIEEFYLSVTQLPHRTSHGPGTN
jgi:CheY-like chemotaxis protein